MEAFSGLEAIVEQEVKDVKSKISEKGVDKRFLRKHCDLIAGGLYEEDG
jgi:hypothetical protein